MRPCLLFMLLLVSACSTGTGQRPVPVEDRAETTVGGPPEGMLGIPAGAPEPGGRTAPLPAVAGNLEPAVIALLTEAGREQVAGRDGSAAAALERALNLQPKHAYLWYRLAALRLKQRNWQQAFVLANKSNSLVSDNPELKIMNWRVIAAAKRQLGDAGAAAAAEARIEQLQK